MKEDNSEHLIIQIIRKEIRMAYESEDNRYILDTLEKQIEMLIKAYYEQHIEILSLNDTICYQADKIKELEEQNRVWKSVISNSINRLKKQSSTVEFLIDEEGKQ